LACSATPPGCALPQPLQDPFSVQVERFDSTADTLSVVTLSGHPLAGWRYWRVFSVGTNDIVVETGAVDTYFGSENPKVHPLNWAGYYIFRGDQLKTWEEDLRYILRDIVQKHIDPRAVQGTNAQYNIVGGAWNPQSPSQTQILNNVCQQPTCN
jgi:hypothetical protein